MKVFDIEQSGKNLKELMKQKGITQREVASEMCVTEGMVSVWVRGLHLPSMENCLMLTDVLGLKHIDEWMVLKEV